MLLPRLDRLTSSAWPLALCALPAVLLLLGIVWLPYLPNSLGFLGADYSSFLPTMLAGDFWHMRNGLGAVPWFNPAECGGVPFQADPQGAYYALPQFLSFAVTPIRALQISFLVYGAAGFLGTFALARNAFRMSVQAGLLAALLFALNGMFPARMLVGHLSFAPFMLLPAAACCLLGTDPPQAHRRRLVLRVLLFGVIFAGMFESGMLVLIPPAVLSLVMIAVIHGIVTGGLTRAPFLRLAAGSAVALILAAGKLAAVWGLMAHLPRDNYPLPGFINALETLWVAFRTLFFGPFDDMPRNLANSFLFLEPHEWDYRVGPVPLLLMAAGVAMMVRDGLALTQARKTAWQVLVILLLIPIALNTYGVGWTALLKALPILRNSSSLVRWFAAYMLPAILAAGLALDRLAGIAAFRPWRVFAAAASAAVLVLLAADRNSLYGPQSIVSYNPRTIEAAWHASSRTGHFPPIGRMSVLMTRDGQVDTNSLTRQDGVALGISQIFCYDPIFGYRLERFRRGNLHVGGVLDVAGVDEMGGGILNIKNPACYVFPDENACAPGDEFPATRTDAARHFVQYEPFDFDKPVWAGFADAIGFWSWPVALLGILGALWPLRRAA